MSRNYILCLGVLSYLNFCRLLRDTSDIPRFSNCSFGKGFLPVGKKAVNIREQSFSVLKTVADPGGGHVGHGPPLSQIRTISYAPLGTF